MHAITTGIKKPGVQIASGVMYENETWNYTALDSALEPAIQKKIKVYSNPIAISGGKEKHLLTAASLQ